MKGFIHSFETFGAVDGPSIRFVLFTSGCKLRCKYCHNPDTWREGVGEVYTAEQIVEIVKKYKNYYCPDGGVTVSGGEPLLQLDFITELFERLKDEGINTCIDTSGNPFDKRDEELVKKFDRLIKVTDLVLLDVKEIDDEKHILLTGKSNKNTLDFLEYLDEKGTEVWIRYVLVPNLTDDETDLKKLARYLKTKKCVTRTDVLPYHGYGESKYEKLGIDYSLKGVKPPARESVEKALKILGKT